MLHKIKTIEDIQNIEPVYPQYVVDEARRIAEILDMNYNNSGMDGGYIVLLENETDTEELKEHIDYSTEPIELLKIIGDYVSLLFLPATEYSISVIMPRKYYNRKDYKI